VALDGRSDGVHVEQECVVAVESIELVVRHVPRRGDAVCGTVGKAVDEEAVEEAGEEAVGEEACK
jgi:hypothetical protein